MELFLQNAKFELVIYLENRVNTFLGRLAIKPKCDDHTSLYNKIQIHKTKGIIVHLLKQ